MFDRNKVQDYQPCTEKEYEKLKIRHRNEGTVYSTLSLEQQEDYREETQQLRRMYNYLYGEVRVPARSRLSRTLYYSCIAVEIVLVAYLVGRLINLFALV